MRGIFVVSLLIGLTRAYDATRLEFSTIRHGF